MSQNIDVLLTEKSQNEISLLTLPKKNIPNCIICTFYPMSCKLGDGHGYFPNIYIYECKYCLKTFTYCECTPECKTQCLCK